MRPTTPMQRPRPGAVRRRAGRATWVSILTLVSLLGAGPGHAQGASSPAAAAAPETEWVEARARIDESMERGDTGEAAARAATALALAEAAFGPDHPNTLRSVNDLALLYSTLSRAAEAEPLFLRAIAGRERVLGESHPDTLNSLASLMALYSELGRTADAERLGRRIQAASQRALESNDPRVLGAAPAATPRSRFIVCPGDARCPRRGVDDDAPSETPKP